MMNNAVPGKKRKEINQSVHHGWEKGFIFRLKTSSSAAFLLASLASLAICSSVLRTAVGLSQPLRPINLPILRRFSSSGASERQLTGQGYCLDQGDGVRW